jgi:hypothetical protein
MSIEPINTTPIQQFIQQVRAADQSRSKEIKLSIDQAKNLAFTMGIVMSRLQGDLEKLLLDSKNSNTESIEIKIDGSDF